MIPIFLVSTSPRRQELMKMVVSDFLILHPTFQETILSKDTPYGLVCRNTLGKSRSVLTGTLPDSYCLISSDTVVVWRNQVMGKPQNQDEAIQYLHNLSGNHHEVITGISIRIQERENKLHRYFTETTGVDFHAIRDEAILSYVRAYNPLDKAGGYGIQEIPNHWIHSVQGELNNVIGLPVQRLKEELIWLRQYINLTD